jgi:hypothetical protein
MASAMMKLTHIQSFRARERLGGPIGAVVDGHTAPIFRRLSS